MVFSLFYSLDCDVNMICTMHFFAFCHDFLISSRTSVVTQLLLIYCILLFLMQNCIHKSLSCFINQETEIIITVFGR